MSINLSISGNIITDWGGSVANYKAIYILPGRESLDWSLEVIRNRNADILCFVFCLEYFVKSGSMWLQSSLFRTHIVSFSCWAFAMNCCFVHCNARLKLLLQNCLLETEYLPYDFFPPLLSFKGILLFSDPVNEKEKWKVTSAFMYYSAGMKETQLFLDSKTEERTRLHTENN